MYRRCILGLAASVAICSAAPGVGAAASESAAAPGASAAGSATQIVAAAPARRRGTCYVYLPSERNFAHRTNSAREEAGITKLRLDPELSRAARLHSREMLELDKLYHTPSDKLARRVTGWLILGENVGFGPTAESLQQAFLDSPHHYANIVLPEFRYMGLGVARRSDNMIWVTVIFEAKENPGTTLKLGC